MMKLTPAPVHTDWDGLEAYYPQLATMSFADGCEFLGREFERLMRDEE